MDQSYMPPFGRGWRDSVTDEPKRDGHYVLFARDKERTAQAVKDGQCPFCFGFWHPNQDTPRWTDEFGGRLVLEHWPRWKELSEIT